MNAEWFEGLTTEQSKEDRALLRVYVGRVLALFAVLLFTAWATGAYAETLKFESRYTTVRLLDKPCELDVPEKDGLKMAKGLFTVVMQTPYGRIPVGQVKGAGCWKRVADGYETVWDDGEKIKFPFGEFHPEGV